MALLEANNISIHFGGLKAVDQFNLKVNAGELVGLIGPNGAGKTTVFNMLTGVYLPTDGDITLEGKSIVGKKPYEIVRIGGSRTFQNIRLFKEMTVLENILIAYHHDIKYSTFASIFRTPAYWKQEKLAVEACLAFLDIFEMRDYAQTLAKNLPYGKQRKLEIARALATKPKILMLDEPAAGMNPHETHELMDTIALIRKKFDIAILLIEHDMSLVMGVCEKIVVLDYGRVIAEGTAEETKNNKDVIRVYLGE